MVNRAQFDKAAIKIFNSFGDIIEDVTYTISGAWDQATESATNSTESIRVSVKPVTKEEADGAEVMIGDMVATVTVSEMTAVPKIDDLITLDSVDYIVRSATNKYKVLHELILRRKDG